MAGKNLLSKKVFYFSKKLGPFAFLEGGQLARAVAKHQGTLEQNYFDGPFSLW
jgi:hypothetical protein